MTQAAVVKIERYTRFMQAIWGASLARFKWMHIIRIPCMRRPETSSKNSRAGYKQNSIPLPPTSAAHNRPSVVIIISLADGAEDVKFLRAALFPELQTFQRSAAQRRTLPNPLSSRVCRILSILLLHSQL